MDVIVASYAVRYRELIWSVVSNSDSTRDDGTRAKSCSLDRSLGNQLCRKESRATSPTVVELYDV